MSAERVGLPFDGSTCLIEFPRRAGTDIGKTLDHDRQGLRGSGLRDGLVPAGRVLERVGSAVPFNHGGGRPPA